MERQIGRQHSKGEARQEEILDTAERLFRQKGVLKTGMRDIMSAIGISAGAMYYHFTSKGAILRRLSESKLAKLRAGFRKLIDAPSRPLLRRIP